MRAYYGKFDRHAHGQGIKGHSTHYCPGCGHGLAHNYVAEAISKLGIQENTIAISPVGCSVFMYYYLDVGNSQAAHGRAPVVALGHKMSNPKSVVISYQGDGDLASIGLTEIVHTAQMGLPLTVIFINNAIYGMTGGQMAPTTLMQQRTQTSPHGRNRFNGEPLKIAEMMAGLDGPIYVERVALFDSVQRNKAKKAIRKAIQLQVENKGFSFIEVLSECPTHWKVSPVEAQRWVKEKMLPIFPLGVKKDISETMEPWFHMEAPSFAPEQIIKTIGANNKEVQQFAGKKFPTHIDPVDISLKLAGSGGDGAQTAALLLTQAAINEEFDATNIPSYGPESRGGTSYADVHIAREKVFSPSSPQPHILLAFNTPSLIKFGSSVEKGGVIIYDSTVVTEAPKCADGVRTYGVPMTQIATDLGKNVVKNIVALGALCRATELLPKESLLTAIRNALGSKTDLIPLNEKAFSLGFSFIDSQLNK